VSSLAQARVALQAEPRIEAILIDAASNVARSGRVAAAGYQRTDRPDAWAVVVGAAGTKGFLAPPAEPGLVDAIAADAVDDSCELVSVDVAIRQLLAVARQIARSDAGVLITRESGTGKAAACDPGDASLRAQQASPVWRRGIGCVTTGRRVNRASGKKRLNKVPARAAGGAARRSAWIRSDQGGFGKVAFQP